MDKNIYLPQPAEVVRVESLTAQEKLFSLRLLNEKRLGHQPGQFVEVSLLGYGEAPISISSPPTNSPIFELCVRKMGNVTTALHRIRKGFRLGIRGPFGRGFPLERLKGSNLIFVAGGIGLVPLRSLINYVLFRRSRYKQITILYGVKSPEEILFAREIRQWEKLKEVKVMVTVDRRAENWKGRVGVVTTLFPEIEVDAKNTYVLVVGPPIMYKYVILALGNKEISSDRIILSLERRMKCGLGKCGHCQIGSFYVCQEGPVFSYSEIRHLEGVI